MKGAKRFSSLKDISASPLPKKFSFFIRVRRLALRELHYRHHTDNHQLHRHHSHSAVDCWKKVPLANWFSWEDNSHNLHHHLHQKHSLSKNLHHIRHYRHCHHPSCWRNNLHNRCLESGPDRHQNHPLGKNLHCLPHYCRCHLPSRRRNNLHNRCLESGLDSHQNNPRRNLLQLPSVFSSTLLFHPVTSQK